MIQFKIKTSVMLMVTMLLLTSMDAAAEKVSTVDAKELFTAKNFIADEPKTISKDISEQVAADVSANMSKQKAILHWDAVNTSAKMEIADSTIAKATPIIITAADIDAQKKAQKQSKQKVKSASDNLFGQVKVPVLNKTEIASAVENKQKIAENKPVVNKINNNKINLPQNHTEAIVSLPPIQSVKQIKEDIVALPPIEAVAAEKVVALPPVQKIS